jgi:hypothetical protein
MSDVYRRLTEREAQLLSSLPEPPPEWEALFAQLSGPPDPQAELTVEAWDGAGWVECFTSAGQTWVAPGTEPPPPAPSVLAEVRRGAEDVWERRALLYWALWLAAGLGALGAVVGYARGLPVGGGW